MDIKYDETVKIILLGNVNVGKTTLCNVLKKKEFNYNYNSTIGVDFHTIYYKKNKNYRIQFWDTAGQEKFRSLVSCYFKKADIIIIMFDINDIQSYDNIIYWRDFAYMHSNSDSITVLLGNKNDLEEKADMDKIRNYANINKIPLHLISIKNDKNFDGLLNIIINNLPYNMIEMEEKTIDIQKGCCVII
jgi:small GTP-binding protein